MAESRKAGPGSRRSGRTLDRRAFLIRSGLAAALTLPLGRFRRAVASPLATSGLGEGAIAAFVRDTFDGLAAMMVPGPDRHSIRQGLTTPEPGGVAAEGAGYTIEFLDASPLPGLTGVVAALAEQLDPVPLPVELWGLVDRLFGDQGTLLDAVAGLLFEHEPPVSLVVALVLNVHATIVDPTSVLPDPPTADPVLSPFSRLTWGQKLEAIRLLEEEETPLAAMLDEDLPEPLTKPLSGTMRLVGAALYALPVFAAYSEYHVFDPATRTLIDRPVGWELTGYQPDGEVAGWDELVGYYRGQRKAIR